MSIRFTRSDMNLEIDRYFYDYSNNNHSKEKTDKLILDMQQVTDGAYTFLFAIEKIPEYKKMAEILRAKLELDHDEVLRLCKKDDPPTAQNPIVEDHECPTGEHRCISPE